MALHGLDAVVERAEHRKTAVEQALVVGVVSTRRRAPHDEDRLRSGLRGLDDVARERVAEDRHRAGDRDDEDVDVLVGEEHVEDLATARVGDRRTTTVDGVGDTQIPGNESVV